MKEKLKSEMTLREYYAGLAMQSLLLEEGEWRKDTVELVSKLSVEIADELIQTLNNKEFEEARNLLFEETERKRIEMEKDPRWVHKTNQGIVSFSKRKKTHE